MFGINSIYVKGLVLLLIFLPFVISMTSGSKEPRRGRLIFLFSILYFFAAFRAETVGGDLDFYIPHFNEVCSVNNFKDVFSLRTSNFEPGYTILCWIISNISNSSFAYLSITSFLSLLGPFYIAKKYSVWPCSSIIIYILLGFYTNTFNNVRQSIAISIILFSIPYLLLRKPFKFLFVVLLAGSAHASALFFVFSYFIKYIRLSFVSFLIVLSASFIISTSFGVIIVQYFGTIFLTKYEELFADGKGQVLTLIYITITMGALYVYKLNKMRIDNATEMFILFMLVASVIQMFSGYFISVVRMTYYFFIPIIVLIPNLIASYKRGPSKILICFFVFLALFYYMVNLYSEVPGANSNSQGVIPYSFNF